VKHKLPPAMGSYISDALMGYAENMQTILKENLNQ